MDALVNKKNTIVQRQRQFQADSRPTFMRGPRSGLYMTLYLGLFSVGIYGSFAGFYNMAKGKKISG